MKEGGSGLVRRGRREGSEAIVSAMIPLALSGQIVIGVAVTGALLLLGWLLHEERRIPDDEESPPDPTEPR
jgi:hypothetical protein